MIDYYFCTVYSKIVFNIENLIFKHLYIVQMLFFLVVLHI